MTESPMISSVWFGSMLARSVSVALGSGCEYTSAASSRSSEGHRLILGSFFRAVLVGSQYLCSIYSISPTTQSPRMPPACQLMRGWKASLAHAGSRLRSFLVHESSVQSGEGGGGGTSST